MTNTLISLAYRCYIFRCWMYKWCKKHKHNIFMPPHQWWPLREAWCFLVVCSILVNAISPDLEEMSSRGWTDWAKVTDFTKKTHFLAITQQFTSMTKKHLTHMSNRIKDIVCKRSNEKCSDRCSTPQVGNVNLTGVGRLRQTTMCWCVQSLQN